MYHYRKRLSKNTIYEDNIHYIKNIIDLLDENSIKRNFIEYSNMYAELFSHKTYKIRYPLFATYYPKVHEVEKVINCLSKEELMVINHE